jgi:starch-binding outer membrane protein, SusD/RagB family
MIMKKMVVLLIQVWIILLIGGCRKFLDEKPGSKMATPETARDQQALLDQYNNLNMNSPASLEISSDNYYLTKEDWDRLSDDLKRMYLWEKDHLFEAPPNDWNYLYRTIYIANTVIEYGEKPGAKEENDNILGQAYFWRGFSFQKAAFIWCLAYDEASAGTDPGIPLRLHADFNEVSVRGSVADTYGQIISDFKKSIQLLPEKSIHAMRPSLAAAYGMLAKTYLVMRNYDSVYKYASLGLELRNDPQDYNDPRILPAASFPFSNLKYSNADIVFESAGPPTTALAVTRGRIDSVLYSSYDANDLRRTIFFRRIVNNEYGFKGSYEGGNSLFAGMTVGELYLMRAEAACRLGNIQSALADLNYLLLRRWKTGTFEPITITDPALLLNTILFERRKELLMRGHRWMDIKRLNKEGANINLVRKLDGQIYMLPAGDLRFALPIPEDVIELSGMLQNPR